MRIAHTRCWALLALLGMVPAPSSGAEGSGVAGVPEPVFHVTFDGTDPYRNLASQFPVTGRLTGEGLLPAVVRGQGVGGSHCLRFPADEARTIVFDDPSLVAAMGQGRSWTLTCWHRRDTLAYGDRHRVVLSLPGAFTLMYHRHGPTAPFLKQLRAASGEAKDLWPSAWGHHLSPGKWVFFAFTYDGTRSKDNFVALSGTERYPVRQRDARTLSFPGGQLAAARAKRLTFGASARGKADYVNGAMIDQVRLYVSRDRDSRGALTAEQLEAVRQADVGEGNLRPIALRPGVSDEERQRRESRFWSVPLSATRSTLSRASSPICRRKSCSRSIQ